MDGLDDYLYKAWWYSVMYGSSAQARMGIVDSMRDQLAGTRDAICKLIDLGSDEQSTERDYDGS